MSSLYFVSYTFLFSFLHHFLLCPCYIHIYIYTHTWWYSSVRWTNTTISGLRLSRNRQPPVISCCVASAVSLLQSFRKLVHHSRLFLPVRQKGFVLHPCTRYAIFELHIAIPHELTPLHPLHDQYVQTQYHGAHIELRSRARDSA